MSEKATEKMKVVKAAKVIVAHCAKHDDSCKRYIRGTWIRCEFLNRSDGYEDCVVSGLLPSQWDTEAL